MEGPAFSSVAESNVYRSWGMDIIGMTNLQEAKLAREAEICYATLALVTDYDCWHPGHDAVSVETVIEYLNKNVSNAQKIMRESIKRLKGADRSCKCRSALKNAIFTPSALWPEATTSKLEAIIKKYSKTEYLVRWSYEEEVLFFDPGPFGGSCWCACCFCARRSKSRTGSSTIRDLNSKRIRSTTLR
jgi:hypothetical protein